MGELVGSMHFLSPENIIRLENKYIKDHSTNALSIENRGNLNEVYFGEHANQLLISEATSRSLIHQSEIEKKIYELKNEVKKINDDNIVVQKINEFLKSNGFNGFQEVYQEYTVRVDEFFNDHNIDYLVNKYSQIHNNNNDMVEEFKNKIINLQKEIKGIKDDNEVKGKIIEFLRNNNLYDYQWVY